MPETEPSFDDETWMRRALELASRGAGCVEPNPMVGCVVVQNGRELASGWHERFGGPHAEVHALQQLPDEPLPDATVYVTLEPCSHHGKTPPCLDLLLSRKPRRVVVAMEDPFPQVAGRGIQGLRKAGIEVVVGVLGDGAKTLNAPYLKRLATGLPWVIAKWAMTLDGAIATETGDSKWITGERARNRAHEIRANVDAIIVGSETVVCDDPLLTPRPAAPKAFPRRLTRVVMDRRFRTPIDCQLVQTVALSPVWVVSTADSLRANVAKVEQLRKSGVILLEIPNESGTNVLEWLLRRLSQNEATNVMIEGGGMLLGAFFDEGFVDQVDCFIAPKILGATNARRPVSGHPRHWMNQTYGFKRITYEACGEDLHVRGFRS